MGDKLIRIVCFLFLIAIMGCSSEKIDMKYPETKKDPVLENIFNKDINDPYRWLEEFTSNEVSDWVEEQNKLSNKYLQNDYQKEIKDSLEAIWISKDISVPFRRGDKTFYYYSDGMQQQAVLMMKGCDDCEAKILLDPNELYGPWDPFG